MKEITVVNVINVEKGKGEEVAERFSEPKAVHTFPGFIKMEVWLKEQSEESDELHICTTWLDKTYFMNWRESRLNIEVHGQTRKNEKTVSTPKSNPILGANLSMYKTLYKHSPQN